MRTRDIVDNDEDRYCHCTPAANALDYSAGEELRKGQRAAADARAGCCEDECGYEEGAKGKEVGEGGEDELAAGVGEEVGCW